MKHSQTSHKEHIQAKITLIIAVNRLKIVVLLLHACEQSSTAVEDSAKMCHLIFALPLILTALMHNMQCVQDWTYIGVKLEVRMMQMLDAGCELKAKEMSTAHLCAIWFYFKSSFMSASEKFNATFIFRVIYILYFSRQCKESSHANYANSTI